MDEVFKALADPSRRALLDSLDERTGQTLTELCSGLAMARQSVSKHLAVLEAANLISTRRQGREKLHYVNAEPINAIADRWIRRYDRARVQALADLKTALEGETMTQTPDFVYTTYIRTTPERLWQALTDPVFSQRYLGHALVTEKWDVGSTYAWCDGQLDIRNPEQVVLDYQPYTRLSVTFHTFVPEIATAKGIDAGVVEQAATEPRSTVTFELAHVEDQVKLTVVHAGFPPGSVVRPLISGGWPWKLSNLKSGLEAAGVAA
ncbi:ArsR family transcriptional regulator [Mycolicibacterium murale]|uniref:ArsR family transcriptional regulator n=1 Tax=Mycolicibacterium murale TaxID=182220 RepID=A0A7I9WPM1_9MYCO|nr:metalloregulator ArsR/SmtB family transcription factor [Mycolicibacterium murale]MCV7182771.1 metalloregulator ArsR/SmtB family transcription factor [Mycolicibacterium murale]GFG59681.1 ArsR family transcriptional regulator [Mycolicibacterium murale]